ncbi:MAG: DegV family EDD domain-containing protein [Nitrospinae bacterium]|nr:DegV family EDD domain-containing protein [Nitrospinota bacterium]
MTKDTLDGQRFRELFIAGARRVSESRDYLNSINVFPVPDGDTGTNMAHTLTKAAEALEGSDGDSLSQVLRTLSQKLRMDAKGNSGIILSEFFHGMFLKLKEEESVRPGGFIEAMDHGKQAAYAALTNPKEGTILTTIRKAVDRLKEAQTDIEDMRVTIEKLVESARHSVDETTGEMELLRENKVVDSGAHGFLLFWEGALNYMKGEWGAALKPIRRVFARAKPEDIKFRYCVEGLVSGGGFVRSDISGQLSSLGDSVIVTCDSGLLKIHVHTNDPPKVFSYLGGLGQLIKTKVDDMVAQSGQLAGAERALKAIGMLTDSTCDLDLALLEELGVEMAPLQVMFGDESFRDRMDITADEFYHRLRRDGSLPRTSLPAPGDFIRALEHLIPHCDKVLAIYISSTLSGAYQAGKRLGDEFGGGKVISYDSGHVSLGLGMMVVEAARMAESGAAVTDILSRLDGIKGKLSTFFTVDTLEYLSKNGRIGTAKKVIGYAFGVKPILEYKDGKATSCRSALGRKAMMKKLVELLEERASRPGFEGRVAVAWSDDMDSRDQVIAIIKERLGVESPLTGRVSPVLGSHVGPGALGVFCF